MNIFSEVKGYLTARQVAENYGLQVRRNGLACCPFHDDKHPSMKIDKNYHCFACAVGGDAIDYVCQRRRRIIRYTKKGGAMWRYIENLCGVKIFDNR